MPATQPLSGHDLLVLFLQLALLLASARLLGETLRRIRQPAVIGELLAGILLGPSVLGQFLPALYQLLFPSTGPAHHLLETVAWVGLVLLLMLTGLEVDINHLRRVGKPAFAVSAFGLIIPFGVGWILGTQLPDRYLTDPTRRELFAAFMATAIAVSAMPVIAKILIDLDLLKRDLGVLVLSAAVVDDTVGWLVLSVIVGLAHGATFEINRLGATLALLSAFVAVSILVARPLLNRLFHWIENHFPRSGAEITLAVSFTFVAAAITERIGVHAVFGAFVAGVLLRQVPRLSSDSLSAIEQFVLSTLAPIFFAYVGLRVDLWSLTEWEMPLLVLAVAIGAKFLGCEIGGRIGGLEAWERLAAGTAMSARGAMGLVVALIGLTLGLLTEETYSILVSMAVVTSALAPIALPFLVRRIPLKEEERRRLEAGEVKRVFRKEGGKLLVPTAGGPHAEAAFRLAAILARHPGSTLTALHVQTAPRRSRLLPGLLGRIAKGKPEITPIEQHLQSLKSTAQKLRTNFEWKTLKAQQAAEAILAEAQRGYDLILIGSPASGELEDRSLAAVLGRTPCHVAIVRAASGEREATYRRILVPTDGSFFARAALEFAVNLAEGAEGEVTAFAVLGEQEAEPARRHRSRRRLIREALEGALLGPNLKPLTAVSRVPLQARVVRSDRPGEAIILEAQSSDYDLIVLGAENKTLTQSLFYGQGTRYVLENAPCDVAVVVPKL